MATERKDTEGSKKGNRRKSGKKGPVKIRTIGKYFLILLVLAGQGFLAYSIVDKYYAPVYKTVHETLNNKTKSPEDFGTYQMEELVVNPAQTNGKRYLLVEISLELEDKEHVPLLESNNMKLKQDMIEALSARTVPELSHVEGRENLREELSKIINTSIGVRSVRNLYFTKYVMQ